MSRCDIPQQDRNPFEFTGNSGVKFCLLRVTNSIEIFESFIGEDINGLIATETNKFAFKFIDEARKSGKMNRKSCDLLWHDTNEGAIRVMVAFVTFQEIVNKPHVNNCHSTNLLLHTPTFGKFMSRDKFLLLLKYLHFSDQDESPKPLRKVRPLFDLFVSIQGKLRT